MRSAPKIDTLKDWVRSMAENESSITLQNANVSIVAATVVSVSQVRVRVLWKTGIQSQKRSPSSRTNSFDRNRNYNKVPRELPSIWSTATSISFSRRWEFLQMKRLECIWVFAEKEPF